MHITQLAPNLFVGPQIAEDDLRVLSREGFTDVVCNRPDAEHPGTASSSSMADAAEGLGLAFHYLPITPGVPFTDAAEELATLVSRPGTKVLAYCRSGARSSNAWSLVQTAPATSRQND